ncbi:hypothetical protein XENORESO_007765 [Xenotaenia resolanae]|uniref:Uncharacterized protein n=1 Tax=Xenotaenia resolanae TaxID=208358 RepID=A0ABV0WEB4_9TELE
MGTKMSFGRGSGDQNTDSHLTSASPPCSFVHTPSDCKQIPDDERGSEDINATDMNQTALRASEHVESDVHLSSKITDRSCRPSEDTLSQVRMNTRSLLTSTSSPKDCQKVQRKRGRRAKIRPPRSKEKKDSGTAGIDAAQCKEFSTTISLPCSSVNPSTGDSDHRIISGSSQDEKSGSNAALNDKVDGDAVLLVKRNIGGPKKFEATTSQNTVSKTFATSFSLSRPNNNLGWTLRSRGEQRPLMKKENSDSNNDIKQTEGTSTENSNPIYNHGVRRRRSKPLINDQVPAKVATLDDSKEASSVLSNEAACAGKAETDKQVGWSADKQETDANSNAAESSVQQQQMQLTEELQSPPEPEKIPAEDLNRLNLVNPAQPEYSDKKKPLRINDSHRYNISRCNKQRRQNLML